MVTPLNRRDPTATRPLQDLEFRGSTQEQEQKEQQRLQQVAQSLGGGAAPRRQTWRVCILGRHPDPMDRLALVHFDFFQQVVDWEVSRCSRR